MRIFRRSVLMPQARAASSFEPMAKTRRPKTLLRSTSVINAASAIANQTPGANSIHGREGKVTASSLIQVAGAFTVC